MVSFEAAALLSSACPSVQRSRNIFSPAEVLFRKAGDAKAIGVACNNLGNTLQAMCREANSEGACCAILDGKCAVVEALALYDEAIRMAEKGYQDSARGQHWLAFGQQLADRLFNRGLCYLLLGHYDCAPEDSRERGLQDMKRARDLHLEITSFLNEEGILEKQSTSYFSQIVRRIQGLAELQDDDDVQITWDARELVEEADQFLLSIWDNPKAPLFQELSPIARLQQLETAVIKLTLNAGKHEEAARLAIRMFAEDEYLSETALVTAAQCLAQTVRDNDFALFDHRSAQSMLTDLRKMLGMCRGVSLDLGKSLLFAVELHGRPRQEADSSDDGYALLEKINENCLKLYDECCFAEDSVAIVASTTNQGKVIVDLGRKKEFEGLQRTSLDIATSSTTDHSSFSTLAVALQMLVDSNSASSPVEEDVLLFLVTDGVAWDFDAVSAATTNINRLNHERNAFKIDLIIFDVGIASDSPVLEDCKRLAALSPCSKFISPVNLTKIDDAFVSLRATLRGRRLVNTSEDGLTMERF